MPNSTTNSQLAPSIEISNLILGHMVSENLELALGPLSLEIAAGETVAIVGPSGCGKTSLLMALIGELIPSSGNLSVGGQSDFKASTSLVFQQNTVFPWLTALENVRYPLAINGKPRNQSIEQANHWLSAVGLKDSGRKYPAELSGGMLQRVAIARALAYEPKFLLLDEPFGQLDELTRLDLAVLLASLLSDSEMTTVLVTHSIEEAILIANTVVVLSGSPGRLLSKVAIEFKTPRTPELLTTPKFHEYMKQIRDTLMEDRRGRD